MNTYFIRHSSALDIDDDTFNQLWDNELIGVHYPHDANGKLQTKDLSSFNWQDYWKQGKSAIKILKLIGKEGGYVFATYENKEQCKVGYIEPETRVELLKGKWGNKNGRQGREAILKVLKFSQVKEIKPIDATSLTVVQPRQGTICRWRKVGKRVEYLYHGITEKKDISYLTPDQQEVLCSEFLRHKITEKYDLPKIQSFLTPIGRTMKDIDIIGVTFQKKKVIAQVTYSEIPDWKIKRLEKYTSGEDLEVILFCRTEKVEKINGITVFPLDLVFELFCNQTDQGKIWLENIV